MHIRCNIPRAMHEPLRHLFVQHYSGLDKKAAWSKIVETHGNAILGSAYRSLTAQINDEEFYRDNTQESFDIDDKHGDFFRTARAIKVTRRVVVESERNGQPVVRTNNGAILREVLYLELFTKGYLKLSPDGKVSIILHSAA